MQNLTRAHNELFRRHPDERFKSMDDLSQYCQNIKQWSTVEWMQLDEMAIKSLGMDLALSLRDKDMRLTEWSFSQLCGINRIHKPTVNRLSADTASRVFRETWPTSHKPLQALVTQDTVRSIHGPSYTRLFNVELLSVVREFAVDFMPPQQARSDLIKDGEATPATGLYCGPEDMFVFMINPTGFVEIQGEAFAPGFFVWNSEIGRRSVGIQTFWFQSCCANHIIWDATDVTEYTRKHTTNVHDALREIGQMIERLVQVSEQRKDSFVKVIRKAMTTSLGDFPEEVIERLGYFGIGKNVAKEALKIAEQQGKFTIFSLVDALTRLAGQKPNAGDRVELDTKSASLLGLVAREAS